MTFDQVVISAILLVTLALFIYGRWRYDVVAMFALSIGAVFGVVNRDDMFAGFGHPAVITVAAVLVISHAIQQSGMLDSINKFMKRFNSQTVQLALLCGFVAISSAFMNNVGALALFMPIALTMAKRQDLSPSKLLIPVSFASLLGGLTTLIGTPPNIIISGMRDDYSNGPFAMFDFAWVGVPVAIAGLIYLVLFAPKKLPDVKAADQDSALSAAGDYMTELRILDDSPYLNRSLFRIQELGRAGDITILSIVRAGRRILAPTRYEIIRESDILVVEGSTESINDFKKEAKLELVSKKVDTTHLSSQQVTILEAVIGPDSMLIGRTLEKIRMSSRFGINVMGISRRGQSIQQRLNRTLLRAGDVLLIQTSVEGLNDKLDTIGAFPLAQRHIQLGDRKGWWKAPVIFAVAILLMLFWGLPAPMVFTMAVGAMVVTKVVDLRRLYETIDWPIIILLGAMIPIGTALETTGTTGLVADGIIYVTAGAPIFVLLIVVIAISMLLSDVINNAATAVIMAPIGVNIAQTLELSSDAFLMAVCIGASSTFLTPIGHQSNLLVMGPGGYKFGDYAKVGWKLDIIVIAVSVPFILLFWGE